MSVEAILHEHQITTSRDGNQLYALSEFSINGQYGCQWVEVDEVNRMVEDLPLMIWLGY